MTPQRTSTPATPPAPDRPRVAIAHDYLTQRGGAERVVLAMHRAFPEAPIYTTLYEPPATFPELADADVRVSPLNRIRFLRHHHRAALPVLAPASSAITVDADLTLVSSTGWAHGFRATGRKLVYCHSPARFLYLRGQYLGGSSTLSTKGAALTLLGPGLLRWDQRAAATADRYLANSTIVAERIARVYGIEADVLFPPGGVRSGHDLQAVPSLEAWLTPGYHLVVSRLMPYKNVDVAVEAFRGMPDRCLVVIGRGPEEARLRQVAPGNVQLLHGLTDAQMRWCYAHAQALIAPSFEDFGLTPLEAYSCGTPVLALRGGGYLDTVEEGLSGLFFDEPTAPAVREVVTRGETHPWDGEAIRRHGEGFSEERFAARLHAEVEALLVPEGGGSR